MESGDLSSASSSQRLERAADPLRAWHRRLVATCAGGAVLIVPLAAWALRPLSADAGPATPPAATTPTATIAHDGGGDAPSLPVIDRSVFDRSLWSHLPKRDSPAIDDAAPKPAPALPLELEWIGVTSIDGTLVAALYDRRADRLRLVRQGERVLDAEVAELSVERLRLTRGDQELVLVRRRPGS
jgi:hypothetical protein